MAEVSFKSARALNFPNRIGILLRGFRAKRASAKKNTRVAARSPPPLELLCPRRERERERDCAGKFSRLMPRLASFDTVRIFQCELVRVNGIKVFFGKSCREFRYFQSFLKSKN